MSIKVSSTAPSNPLTPGCCLGYLEKETSISVKTFYNTGSRNRKTGKAELAVRRGQTPPIGPISLAKDNARLDTSWETATGNGTYPARSLSLTSAPGRLVAGLGCRLMRKHGPVYGSRACSEEGTDSAHWANQPGQDNARLDTSWETATGNGTYPGFTLVGLVCYTTVERSVNNYFQYLTDTDKDTATATASKPSYQISSKVVTALVSNPATEHLVQPVILTFKHLQVRAESAEMNYTVCSGRRGVSMKREGRGQGWLYQSHV
ncbi:uncharacterized protein [Salvelinus sp. IW2-2015]|uniref:uncharacterized protein n=1 Tax=Salvelinus sp. IW2-2015 TaxID=2691554 RepID=UPI0038D489E7